MSNYLETIIARTEGNIEVVQPRIRSFFEPEGNKNVFDDARIPGADSSPFAEIESRPELSVQHPLVQNEIETGETSFPLERTEEQPTQMLEIASQSLTKSPTRQSRDVAASIISGSSVISGGLVASESPLRHSAQEEEGIANPLAGPQHAREIRPMEHSGGNDGLRKRQVNLDLRKSRDQTRAPSDAASLEPKETSLRSLSPGPRDAQENASGSPPIPRRKMSLEPRVEPMRESDEATNPSPPDQRIVRVTIGRVDVRAVFPQKSGPKRTRQKSVPRLSLDDYLEQRGDGNR